MSLLGLVADAIGIVTAPVEIAIDLTQAVTKPIADAAQEAVNAVKSLTEE